MAVNAAQIRDLLMPGLRQIEGTYGGVIDLAMEIDHLQDQIQIRARHTITGEQRISVIPTYALREGQMVGIWHAAVRNAIGDWGAHITPGMLETLRQRREVRIPPRMHPLSYDDMVFPTASEDRARKLLLGHLSAEQRKAFKAKKEFLVAGKSGREYRLTSHRWPTKNVTWVEKGNPLVSYCAQPNYGKLPMGDILLAQKIALETDDRTFCKIACHVAHPNFYSETRSHFPPAPLEPKRPPLVRYAIGAAGFLLVGQVMVQLVKLF